jgi:hypothetical protein
MTPMNSRAFRAIITGIAVLAIIAPGRASGLLNESWASMLEIEVTNR